MACRVYVIALHRSAAVWERAEEYLPVSCTHLFLFLFCSTLRCYAYKCTAAMWAQRSTCRWARRAPVFASISFTNSAVFHTQLQGAWGNTARLAESLRCKRNVQC